MLKAKAKAAATAAKQKKLASERAAAAAAQAAQTPAPPPSIVNSSASGTRGSRPSVTQYWVDNQSSALAPGGGIQRIGYDQAKFDEAIRAVVIDPKRASFEVPTSETAKVDASDKEVKDAARKEETTEKGSMVDEKSVELLVKELDLSTKEATLALQRSNNDLQSALDHLLTPPPPSTLRAPSGRPAQNLVSVSN